MRKKKYVKPSILVINVGTEKIVATSSKFVGVGDEEADPGIEVLSIDGGGYEENSWGNLW